MRRVVLHEDMITNAQDSTWVEFDTENLTYTIPHRQQFISKDWTRTVQKNRSDSERKLDASFLSEIVNRKLEHMGVTHCPENDIERHRKSHPNNQNMMNQSNTHFIQNY
jgi:hypothetical protein